MQCFAGCTSCDHYQSEMIKPQHLHDIELLGRCEIRIGRIN